MTVARSRILRRRRAGLWAASDLGAPRWRVMPQMPQLRLGDFAFQNAALADWPAGGLRFHLQGRETTPLKPKEEGR